MEGRDGGAAAARESKPSEESLVFGSRQGIQRRMWIGLALVVRNPIRNKYILITRSTSVVEVVAKNKFDIGLAML